MTWEMFPNADYRINVILRDDAKNMLTVPQKEFCIRFILKVTRK